MSRRRLPLAAALFAALLAVLGLSIAAAPLAESAAAHALAHGPAHAAAHATAAGPATAETSSTTSNTITGTAAGAAAGTPRTVVIAGIPGLRWTDVSPQATPNLWRLAGTGSVGSLVVRTVQTRACPADGWLTLNSGARAAAPRPGPHQCGPVPPPAALSGLEAYNNFHQNPRWGLLGSAAGQGCVNAAGPGGALALAPESQRPGAQTLPSAAGVTPAFLARCPLTVADLGAIPAGQGRAAAVHASDQALGRIAAALPAGAVLMVAAPADDGVAHLRVVTVDGPGYQAGLLRSASTRQPGLVDIRDLTASVLAWRGTAVPAGVTGSAITRSARDDALAATIHGLNGQDTQAQVWQATEPLFFATYAVTEGVVFIAIGLILWGGTVERRRRRAAIWRVIGVCAGSIPVGTFLASLVPWWTFPAPAALLYAMAVVWAAVVAAVALAGPWRHDPLGPPGVVGAITVAVLGLDVITGSRLQLGTPFGLSTLLAGRFYGLGNNAIGLYGTAGMLAAAWLAGVAARAGRNAHGPAAASDGGARRNAVLAVTAVAVFTVVASGLFGSKFGGTIAMVPGFLLLGLCAAGVRINGRRAAVICLSGVAAVILLSLASYFIPVTGHSDITAFVGQALHGSNGAGDTLQRKISANIGSLTQTPYSPLVPVVVAATGLMLLRPSWFRANTLVRARAAVPLMGPVLAAIWIVGVLGWFADDSGVTVAAAALPLALPLAIAAMAAVPVTPGATAGTPPATQAAPPAPGAQPAQAAHETQAPQRAQASGRPRNRA